MQTKAREVETKVGVFARERACVCVCWGDRTSGTNKKSSLKEEENEGNWGVRLKISEEEDEEEFLAMTILRENWCLKEKKW